MSSGEQVQRWYTRAQIDYVQHYMALYASFNAWYRETTGAQNDREALNRLRKGNDIWDAYLAGTALVALRQPMILLTECTQREPLSVVTPHWNGEVSSIKDWASLVEFWYRVRCLVMHGAVVRHTYVYLAYQTLNIFMAEVINRHQ